MNSPEIIDRREFLKRAARITAGVASVMVLGACGLDITAPKTDAERLQWENLPPTERLKKLIEGDYPKTFNVEREVTIATAQTYCEQTTCNISPEYIASKIYYKDKESFVREYYAGSNPTKKEAENIGNLIKGFYNPPSGNIYINRDFVNKEDKYGWTIREQLPTINSGDQIVIGQISILSHEITHMNMHNTRKDKDIVEIDSFSIADSKNNVLFTISGLYRFAIIGRDSYGNPDFILGGEEAITDLTAQIIVQKKIGIQYYSNIPLLYSNYILSKLNRDSGVTDEEFLRYAAGDLEPTDLLKKWGSLKKDPMSNNLTEGVHAFGAIGLYLNRLFFKEPKMEYTPLPRVCSFKI